MTSQDVPSGVDLGAAEVTLLRNLGDAPVDVRSLVGVFPDVAAVLKAADRPVRHGLVQLEEQVEEQLVLSDEGRRLASDGLPERRAVAAILAAGGRMPMDALGKALGREAPIAVGQLKRKGWATLEKGETTKLVAAGEPVPDEDEQALAEGRGTPSLLARGLAEKVQRTTRTLTRTQAGSKAAKKDAVEEVNQITPRLIAEWDGSTRLRRFDVDVEVAPRHPGRLHPLTLMEEEIRAIFFGMGFTEIAGDYIESAFWNMDALFIPQDHPARDMQDTFYLDAPPMHVADLDLARAKEVHETGGATGSAGWGGSFDPDVSRRALLRTHTTNTTVRYLADAFAADRTAAQAGKTAAYKVFGIGRVFRKETMDSTHLPEFTQIEGIVTEPGADFDMLVGLCKEFFQRMGFEVRFRPAYFPYTEPSMEIDVRHRGRWMELGGCGVFRPEVTQPLGVAHPVLAWGLGLERLAMLRLELSDIRDLYISDLQWLQEQPI